MSESITELGRRFDRIAAENFDFFFTEKQRGSVKNAVQID